MSCRVFPLSQFFSGFGAWTHPGWGSAVPADWRDNRAMTSGVLQASVGDVTEYTKVSTLERKDWVKGWNSIKRTVKK